jgi:hypothetical protein
MLNPMKKGDLFGARYTNNVESNFSEDGIPQKGV